MGNGKNSSSKAFVESSNLPSRSLNTKMSSRAGARKQDRDSASASHDNINPVGSHSRVNRAGHWNIHIFEGEILNMINMSVVVLYCTYDIFI